MKISRRQSLMGSLFGAGAIGLRALATGLPVGFLLDPKRALAAPESSLTPQYLLLSVSANGNPLNTNCPGTYVTGLPHSTAAEMAPTELSLGGQKVTAAKPWSALSQAVLDRTAFFHYATRTIVHPDGGKVLRLFEGARKEMTVSLCAKAVQPALGCLQSQPLAFAGAIEADGRALPTLSAVGIGKTLANDPGPLEKLQQIRDRDLDRLNALFKANGTKAERDYLDKLALSQTQVRKLSTDLLQALSTIKDNGTVNQMLAACVLFKMNVAPAATMFINFGNDLHSDIGYGAESSSLVNAIGAMNQLFTTILPQFGLQDQVTLSIMDVFGRVLVSDGSGRAHHGGHCAGFIIGKNVKAGVVGGLSQPSPNNFVASSLSSTTGLPDASGDVPFGDLLGAYGKTLAAAVGVSSATIDASIDKGKIVRSALVAAPNA